MTKNSLVVKANKLIEGAYKLSPLEQKILVCAMSEVSRSDKDFKTITLKVSDLKKTLGIESNNAHEHIEEIMKKLRNKDVIIQEPKGRLYTKWVAGTKYNTDGTINISFDLQLKPYLLQLTKEFTQYQLKNVLKLNSFYSLRIYELLKQFEGYKKRVFHIEELRNILGIEEHLYSRFTDFETRVLKVAKKEINLYTDIKVDYEKIKIGREIKQICFVMESNEKQETKQISTDKEELKEKAIIDAYMEFQINSLKSIIKQLDEEEIRKLLALSTYENIVEKYILIKTQNTDINNLVGFLKDAIKNDYKEPVQIKSNNKKEIKTQLHNLDERHKKYTPEEFERIALENNKKKFESK